MQASSPVFPLAMQTFSLSAFRQCRHPPHVPVVCLPSGMHADIFLHLPSGNADILSAFRQRRNPPCLTSCSADILPVCLQATQISSCLPSGNADILPICLQAMQTSSLYALRQCRYPPCLPSGNADILPVCLKAMQTSSLSAFRQCRHPLLSAFRQCRHRPPISHRQCRHPPLSPTDNADIRPYLQQTMQTSAPISLRQCRHQPLFQGARGRHHSAEVIESLESTKTFSLLERSARD